MALHRILVGYDDSDQAKDAVALAAMIRDATQTRLVLAGILPQDPLTGGRDVLFEDSDAELKRVVEHAAAPVDAEPLTAPSSSAARGLHQLAEELHADLIVVGSSHRGRVGRAVAGTTAERLLHGASCAVSIAPKGYRDSDHRLHVTAVGYDGLPESKEALAAATALAKQAGGTLRLVTVADPQAFGGPGVSAYPLARFRLALQDHYQRQLDEGLAAVPSELESSGELVGGDPARALAAEAEKRVDLLIVGSRGYGPLRRVLLGSVSHALIKSTPCPLLVVPRGTHETAHGVGAGSATAVGSQADGDRSNELTQVAEEREHIADERMELAEEREGVAERREHLTENLEERALRLEAREATADRRESLANERERIADERERIANHRELLADEREGTAEGRELERGERVEQQVERERAARRREQSQVNREMAATEREEAEEEREKAAQEDSKQ